MQDSDVCNEALSMLGQSPIAAIDDGSINANRCRFFYSGVVDSVLRSHRWQCARFFESLGETTVPAFKWTHAFRLPNGTEDSSPYCLRVWEVNDCPDTIWALAGNRTLVTNEATAKIEYVGRVSNPGLWDALLYQVIVTMLASKLAVPLRHDAKEAQSLYQIAMAMMHDAMNIDSQERSIETFSTTDLIDVRGD